MANAATAADHITLNPGQGGAVVATDFVNTTDMGYGSGTEGPAHFQVVKLSTAGPGGFALLSDSSPAPAKIVSIGDSLVSAGFIAVRGNTLGDAAVPVSISGATLTVSDITIIGGTLDRVAGASCDIRSVASGVEFTIRGTGADKAVAVKGDVSVPTGLSADIRSLPLPTGITCYSVGFNDTVVQGFAGFTLASGVKVKNYFSGLEGLTAGEQNSGGGLLCVGFTGALSAGASTGYLLGPGEEVFIEIMNMDQIVATSVDYDGSTTYVIASIMGT